MAADHRTHADCIILWPEAGEVVVLVQGRIVRVSQARAQELNRLHQRYNHLLDAISFRSEGIRAALGCFCSHCGGGCERRCCHER